MKLIFNEQISDNQILNLIQLAETEMSAGRHNEAINFYNTILSLNTTYPSIWFNKAVAVFKSSTLGNCRFLESKAFFEKVITLTNDSSVNKIISEKIIDLANTYYPSYENFFKDHFMAPSSVDSLFNTYIEFDKMIFWATEISPENTFAYETGYNLCRQIVEMPKKYVNDQRWAAFGAELAGKITKNYGKEISSKIDREIATEVKNKIERYTKTIISNAHKYEKGIKGIPELKQLIEHYQIVSSKPNISSEGKTFEDWEISQKSFNNKGTIAGAIFTCIGVYNLFDNNWNITFWSIVWLGLGIFLLFTHKWNKPTFEKYSKQQGDLADWLNKSHNYINSKQITSELLDSLYAQSKNIYESYYYFNTGNKIAPSTIVTKINELFLKSESPYKLPSN
jgi:tetratricopeptide (TPR) repeat protein